MAAAQTWSVELGDAREHLACTADASIDLVYMDPPFCTGRVHTGRTRRERFDDRWVSLEAYIEFLAPVLAEGHRVLRPTGTLLLHCDQRTCHHLWITLERIFGRSMAVNHLIWSYGLGGSGPRSFARKHDDILVFARSDRYWFEPPMVPSRSRRMGGAPKKATDVLEIPSLNNMAHERCGWPTQKPLALLEVLVGACCPPDGVVLDPFCGSGTTLVAALKLGRRAIGVDQSPCAVEISRRRLLQVDAQAPGDTPAAPGIPTIASRSRRRRIASTASAATLFT